MYVAGLSLLFYFSIFCGLDNGYLHNSDTQNREWRVVSRLCFALLAFIYFACLAGGWLGGWWNGVGQDFRCRVEGRTLDRLLHKRDDFVFAVRSARGIKEIAAQLAGVIVQERG